MTELLFDIWRIGNAVLSSVGLIMLLIDVWRRRSMGVSARFYWEAVALLLFVVAYGNIANVINQVQPSVIRSMISTVAVTYLVVSILAAWSDTRRGTREDE